eukprot:7646999-Alexandrium_andersonii.AAC.1
MSLIANEATKRGRASPVAVRACRGTCQARAWCSHVRIRCACHVGAGPSSTQGQHSTGPSATARCRCGDACLGGNECHRRCAAPKGSAKQSRCLRDAVDAA